MEKPHGLPSVVTVALVAVCLVGMLVLLGGAAASGMLGGSADVGAPLLLLLVVALSVAFVGPVVSQPAAGVEKGFCAALTVLLLTVGAVLGVGWFTGAIGAGAAWAVERVDDRQLTVRLGCVTAAALLAHPLGAAIGGLAWLALPVALAVAAVFVADAIAAARRAPSS